MFINDGASNLVGLPWMNKNGTWQQGVAWINDGGIWKIQSPSRILTSISVSQGSHPGYVIVEEPIDLTGMIVTAYYSDGTVATVDGWSFTPAVFTKLTSPQDITISYNENGVTAMTTYSMIVYSG